MKRIFLITITLVCIIQSCAKERTSTKYNIKFKESFNLPTKGTSYLNCGVKASILTYKYLEQHSSNFTQMTFLTANGYGNFSSDRAVALPIGIYNFFSISYNNQSPPFINFNWNLLATPQNKIDYLWANKLNQAITSSQIITLNYKHISTKIKLTVAAPSSFKNLIINYIKFTLPDCSNSYLNLKTGEINSSHTVRPLSEILGSGNSRTFITIPCSATKEIEVSIDATINEKEIKNVIYKTSIDSPFEGGTFYTIDLNIEDLINSTIILSCKEWSYNYNNIPY